MATNTTKLVTPRLGGYVSRGFMGIQVAALINLYSAIFINHKVMADSCTIAYGLLISSRTAYFYKHGFVYKQYMEFPALQKTPRHFFRLSVAFFAYRGYMKLGEV